MKKRYFFLIGMCLIMSCGHEKIKSADSTKDKNLIVLKNLVYEISLSDRSTNDLIKDFYVQPDTILSNEQYMNAIEKFHTYIFQAQKKNELAIADYHGGIGDYSGLYFKKENFDNIYFFYIGNIVLPILMESGKIKSIIAVGKGEKVYWY